MTVLALLASSHSPSYASGRAALFKAAAKKTGIGVRAPLSPRALNYGLGIGLGTALIVPRLGHSSLPSPIQNMPAPTIGGTLSAIPEAPTLLEVETAQAAPQAAAYFPTTVRDVVNPADESRIDRKKLEEAASTPIDAEKAGEQSETLGATATEVQREGGAHYGAVFDNFGRKIPTAKESGPQHRSVYSDAGFKPVSAKSHPIRLPSRSNFQGMITALRDLKTFQQPGLAQLKAVINKAVQRKDLRFMSQIALLSYHDPRVHNIAVQGIQRLKDGGGDFSIAAGGTLQSINHYRTNQTQLQGRSDMIPTNLLSHIDFYSRR